MIKPKLKSLFIQFTPQENGDPEDDFWTIIRASIGTEGKKAPDGSEAADLFLFYATSPKRLQKIISKKGYEFGHKLIIVEKYNEELIKQAIEKLIAEFKGDNWDIVAQKIGRYGQWEFESYDEWKEKSK